MSVRSWARGWSSPRTAAALLAVVLALALAGLRATVRVRAADPPDYQGACSAGEPWFATACYYGLTRSDKTGMVYEPRAASVVLFADTPNDGPHRVAATIEQVGTVWGLAYRSREQALYAAAYHKVQLPFGPAGPGAVYRIDLATGQVRPFLTVPNVGPDRHERTIRFDPGAESWTSRTGLGDLDLSPDESELVVANLDDRRIYRFVMPDGTFLGSFANGAAGEAWSAEARAFGLAHDGTFVYHAVVRSAEVSGRETDLALHVYRSLPDGSAMAEVAAVSLDGPRGNLKGISRTVDLAWQPWRDGQRGVSAGYPFIYDLSLYPMPLATDIVLAAGSSMVVGLRDRRSDSRRFFDRSPDLSLGLDVGLGIGDLLYASFNGRTWDFDTGDEHFDDQVLHVSDESALGGLAGFDRGRRVVAGSYLLDTDPGFVRLFEGAYWYETASGQRVQHEALCDPARLNPLARLRLVETVYAHDGPGGPFSGELRAPGSVGDVEVLCARDAVPTSTATVTDAPTSPPRDPTPPTPTPTSSPTASSPPPPTPPSPTRTRTPTETPTRAPTPTPRALYLPIALRERCPVDKQHVDVALVIDASTSMRDDRTATGRTKLEAALEAATAFVGALGLPLDQAAVVGFNSDAWVEHPLTGRRSDVEAALARIPDGVREQTRIDLGIAEAHRELLCPRRLTGNRPAMIVLTDGLANPEPASTAVRRAAEAKADGITIFTIGLGHEGELNVPELTQMATRPDYFYHAPDAEDLAALYQAIAVELPCPGVRLWGRR